MQTKLAEMESGWKSIYRTAGIAAFIMTFLIPIQGMIFAIWPPPQTVTGWFELYQRNHLIGLLDMDLLLTIDYILLLIIFIALWEVLRHTNPWATLALVFQLVGITTYFSSTAAFEMLDLSNRYASATSATDQTIFLAAGQTMISVWQGTAFNVSYILGCIALVTMSAVMLRNTVFTKTTSRLGLLAGILMTIPPTVGMAGIVISFLSLLPTIPWLILIAKKFIQLSRTR